VARRQGDAAEAAELFERALALAPEEVTATIGLARLGGGRDEAAVARLETLAARRPGDPALAAALAAVYLELPGAPGRGPRRALEPLSRAPGLYGEGEETRLRALTALGRRDEARRLLAESPWWGREERDRLAPLLD
jgi:predicted Zn-dependent protease